MSGKDKETSLDELGVMSSVNCPRGRLLDHLPGAHAGTRFHLALTQFSSQFISIASWKGATSGRHPSPSCRLHTVTSHCRARKERTTPSTPLPPQRWQVRCDDGLSGPQWASPRSFRAPNFGTPSSTNFQFTVVNQSSRRPSRGQTAALLLLSNASHPIDGPQSFPPPSTTPCSAPVATAGASSSRRHVGHLASQPIAWPCHPRTPIRLAQAGRTESPTLAGPNRPSHAVPYIPLQRIVAFPISCCSERPGDGLSSHRPAYLVR